MNIVSVTALEFEEIKLIRYQKFPDDRGYFTETYRKSDLAKDLPGFEVMQINESRSKGHVLRGMHFQWNPFQEKLVRTVKGHMIDLFMDIRTGSPTYGKIAAHDMPDSNDAGEGEWIYIPKGFAHGCIFLTETTIEYLCSSEYSPGNEAGINPLSADLNWSMCDPKLKAQFDEMIKTTVVISDKDRAGLTLAQWKADSRSKHFSL